MAGKKWKKLLKICLVGCIVEMVALSGCGAAGQEIMDEEGIRSYLDSLESYEAQISVTFYSNKNENTYLVRQQAQKDGKYRMEILEPAEFSGVTTLSDGQSVMQTDPSIRGMVKAKNTPIRATLLLHTFIKNYTPGDGTFSQDEEGTAVMKAAYSSGTDKAASGVLRFNTATRQPESLEILDRAGNVSLRILYRSFEANKELAPELFEIGGEEESGTEQSQPANP